MALIRLSPSLSTDNFPSVRYNVIFVPVIEWPPCLILDSSPSNTNTFDLYQYHPDENTWKWKPLKEEEVNQEFMHVESVKGDESSITEIVLSISISGTVNEDDILEVLGNNIKIIKIKVNNPDRTWLKYKEQLLEFKAKYTRL